MIIDAPVEILLVEDDRDDVKLTLHALKRFNISNRIHVVGDGAEALDFIFCTGAHSGRTMGHPPKVVLLDIKLPRVDGLEVLRRIRADPRTTGLPVVLLTSSREEGDVADGYRLHANSYIVKPVDFDQFSEAIRELGMYWLVLNVAPSWDGADGGPPPGAGTDTAEVGS
jgi:two-component system response regulator